MHTINEDLTQLYLIRENISNGAKIAKPFDPNKLEDFYTPRALHIQTMTLLGTNLEYLVKLVIKNRGYSILEVDHVKTEDNKAKINYTNKTIPLKSSLDLFNKSNYEGYFDRVKSYKLHDSFMGYAELTPLTCLNMINKMRNNYIHKGAPLGESNGIVWYTHNLTIWIAKKEFPNYFNKFKYIGNNEIKSLFKGCSRNFDKCQ